MGVLWAFHEFHENHGITPYEEIVKNLVMKKFLFLKTQAIHLMPGLYLLRPDFGMTEGTLIFLQTYCYNFGKSLMVPQSEQR